MNVFLPSSQICVGKKMIEHPDDKLKSVLDDLHELHVYTDHLMREEVLGPMRGLKDKRVFIQSVIWKIGRHTLKLHWRWRDLHVSMDRLAKVIWYVRITCKI